MNDSFMGLSYCIGFKFWVLDGLNFDSSCTNRALPFGTCSDSVMSETDIGSERLDMLSIAFDPRGPWSSTTIFMSIFKLLGVTCLFDSCLLVGGDLGGMAEFPLFFGDRIDLGFVLTVACVAMTVSVFFGDIVTGSMPSLSLNRTVGLGLKVKSPVSWISLALALLVLSAALGFCMLFDLFTLLSGLSLYLSISASFCWKTLLSSLLYEY